MTAYIKKRVGKTGPRYLVYWRRSSHHKERFAGSFKTKKEAQTRLDVIRGELAAGRDPGLFLAAIKLPPPQRVGLSATWKTWARSRHDVGEAAQNLYRNSHDRWTPILGATADPHAVTVPGVIAGIDEMLDDLAPATVRIYLSHLAMVLDFADVAPNPARSQKIKLPTVAGAEKQIPSNQEWAGILARVSDRSRGAVRVMECGAFRVSEACGIEAGDVDRPGGQVLVRRSVTKTRAGKRWVPLPAELLDVLPLAVTPTQVYADLVAACDGFRYGTHALRHRRISLWLRQGVDPVQVARWAGHAKPSESTDTYGHTVVDALEDEWLGFWQGVYGQRETAGVEA